MDVRKLHKRIGAELLEWYEQHHRDLPWRQSHDPFHIWLSEIILQQTRIDQGLPYYRKFVERFPDVCSLAHADLQEILRLWQGLGYYSRARNLHRCARQVCDQHDGNFPREAEQLQKLPGIGPYTAAAIASIAFQQRVPAIDGNALRVITRLFAIDLDISRQSTVKTVREIAGSLMPAERPDLFNQAVMEFGARHCTPANPRCDSCELKNLCKASQLGIQHLLPYKEKKLKKKDRYFHYLVIRLDNQLFMRQRSEKDIWQGLFEFYLVEYSAPEPPEKVLSAFPGILHREQSNQQQNGCYMKHVLTHQIIHARFIVVDVHHKNLRGRLQKEGYQGYDLQEIDRLPKSKLIDRFLKQHYAH